MNTPKRNHCNPVAALLIALVLCASAFSQAQPSKTTNGNASDAEIVALPELTVTAEKREQNIQDVPVSITAFTTDTLATLGFNSVQDLQTVTPGVFISQGSVGGLGTAVYIRGLGTPALNQPNLESSTGIFVDGIYYQQAGIALGDMTDVQRIEVLKGPQGTLFGKNTTAGAITVYTNEPTAISEGQIAVTGGNFNDRQVTGFVNLPLSDTLAARISLSDHVEDGYLTDINTGQKYDNVNRYDLRAQLLWKPTEKLSLRFLAERNYRDENGSPVVPSIANANMSLANSAANSVGLIGPLDILTHYPVKDFYTAIHYQPHQLQTDEVYLIDAKYDLGWAQFKSLSGFHYNRSVSRSDSGGAPGADYLGFTQPQLYRQWSEEIELSGLTKFDLPWLRSVDWVAGMFYDNEYNNYDWEILGGTQLAGLYGATVANAVAGKIDAYNTVVDTDTGSLFLHFDGKLTDKLHFIGGIRGNYESTSGTQAWFGNWPVVIAGANNPLLIPGNDRSGKDTGAYLSATAGLQYFFTKDVNAYFTYAHGYKSGALDLTNDNDGVRGITAANLLIPLFVAPEFADDYEVGIKSYWLDHRLSLDLDVFDEQFRNFQLTAFNGFATTLIGLPSESTKGFDVSVNARPFAGLTLNASVQRADAKIGSDVTESLSVGGPALAGRRLPDAPLWSEAMGATYRYRLPKTRADAFVHADATHQSSIVTDINQLPGEGQRAYWVLNTRVGMNFASGKYEIALFAKNLTNTYYVYNQTSTRSGIDAYVGLPRMWGVTFTTHF